MSGIVSGINYSLLFSSDPSTTADASSAILTALYSGSSSSAGPSTAVSTGNPLLDLKIAQTNETADVATEALQPQVSQAITAFKTAVAHSKTIQDALANPAVQRVLLTANGLANYIGDTALVQKVLLSDPSDPQSLVNQLGDYSFLSTVQTYNFGSTGLTKLQNPSVVATLTSAYAEVQWRQSLNAATPGLSNALDFLGNASSIKSINDILDNFTNFEVITTALGIPQQIVNQDTEAQQAALASRVDIERFQDPQYVTSLTDQYLLTMQENSRVSSADSTSLVALAVQAGGLVV